MNETMGSLRGPVARIDSTTGVAQLVLPELCEPGRPMQCTGSTTPHGRTVVVARAHEPAAGCPDVAARVGTRDALAWVAAKAAA